jgi:hypothetical protein
MTKNAAGVALPNASEVLPRQQIFSTPFAFRADVAGTVLPDGVLSAAIKDGEVKAVDLAASAVTTQSLVDGAVTTGKIATGAVQGSNIASQGIPPGKIAADYAVFREEQDGDVFGGTALAGWVLRTLNAGTVATPPGGSTISRSGNTITLQSGTYLIKASAPMYALGNSQLVLRDVTGSPASPVVKLRGTSEYIGTNTPASSASTIEDYLTVESGPRQYQLWQYCRSGDTNYPGRLGVAVNEIKSPDAPDKNIYTRIHIQKIQ